MCHTFESTFFVVRIVAVFITSLAFLIFFFFRFYSMQVTSMACNVPLSLSMLSYCPLLHLVYGKCTNPFLFLLLSQDTINTANFLIEKLQSNLHCKFECGSNRPTQIIQP